MTQIFLYDNATGSLNLNIHEILLVKEFDTLWNIDRNKCDEDDSGEKRLRAWREFKYIWLYADFKSPYFQYLEMEKHKAAMLDSGLSEDEFLDPDFRAAVKKYMEIIDSSRVLILIKTGYRTLEKLRVYLDEIDLDERDPQTQKPIFKASDILSAIGSIGTMSDKLKELEEKYKKDLLEGKKSLRGDKEIAYDD